MRPASVFGASAITFVAVVLYAVLASARESPPPRRTPPHLEQPDDPPGRRRPVPPGPRPERGFAPRGGYWYGVQVNVDAAGENIVGDAANEPSIAIDPTDPNRIAIGWRQFDTISSNFRQAGYAFSRDAGRTWSFSGVIEPGVFRSDPVLESHPAGHFVYYSLRQNFFTDLFISFDRGESWPVRVNLPGGDKAWLTIDKSNGPGHGHVYAAWSTAAGCCQGRTFTRSTDGGMTYMTAIALPSTPVFGTLAVGPDSELYVAGINFPSGNNPNFVVARSLDASDPDVTPTFAAVGLSLGGAFRASVGPNPGGLLGQVWIDVDRSDGPSRGHVYLLCSVDPPGPDPMDVMFSRSTDGGQTWSAPIRVNDDVGNTTAWQWFGTMSVAPDGRIDAVWNDTRNDPDNLLSELMYAYSTDGGLSWSANAVLSPPWDSRIGWPNQNKIGDYYDMQSDNVGVSLAYAATFNGEQDVYYLRIGPYDCNGNGVADEDDIAGGASEDCNQNGIPDECDRRGDFDADRAITPDDVPGFAGALVDIDSGCSTLADVNTNGASDGEDIVHFLKVLYAE